MKKTGRILWHDLTIDNAEEVKDFYCKVVGWESSEVDQNGYVDFNIHNPNDSNEVIAGICHKRGPIKNFPSQWLMYITVEDLDTRLKTCEELGGKIIEGPDKMGNARFAIIQDPAGACLVLFQE